MFVSRLIAQMLARKTGSRATFRVRLWPDPNQASAARYPTHPQVETTLANCKPHTRCSIGYGWTMRWKCSLYLLAAKSAQMISLSLRA